MTEVIYQHGEPTVLIAALSNTSPGTVFATGPHGQYVAQFLVAYNTTPSNPQVNLEISDDKITWAVLTSTTNSDGEYITEQYFSARFIRANPVATDGKLVTATLFARQYFS
jgi:hypothetical protein